MKTSINQVSTANITFQAAKRLEKNDWIIKISKCYIVPEKNNYLFLMLTRNCR